MIQETKTFECRVCKRTNSVKNGTNHYKECGTYRVLSPKPASSEIDKQMVLRAGLERCSLRGIERIFDITRQTVVRWISTPIQKLPKRAETLLPAFPDDVLELDEVWSFVLKKAGP
jgi:hypothetical protein